MWPLLTMWGGEAVYMYAEPEAVPRLRGLGSPSIVVVDLPLSAAECHMYPGLSTALGAHLARLPGLGSSMHYMADVPASAVVYVWQPGRTEYDRFPDLPRA